MAGTVNIPLLNAEDCALILIDHEPQMFFGVQSHDRKTIANNVTALAKGAKLFNVPTILTTVADRPFSGPIIPELQAVFPNKEPISRTSMNSWEDENLRQAVEQTGKRKLVMAALWTEVCLAFPALSALANDYEVYFVTDASGGATAEVHERAVQRMIQAGGVPMTWQQTILEWQRDWANEETYNGIMNIIKEHSGAYGQGVFYAETMVQSYPGFEGYPEISGNGNGSEVKEKNTVSTT